MSDIQIFDFEERRFRFTYRPASKENAPLLVILHGHVTTPRPSKFSDPDWNVLCPIDDFGFDGTGSWYLGEGGDFFWLRAMPALINHVYNGSKIFFAGSSMGGYGAILHGSLNEAYAVYANVAQTVLLGSTYSNSGMNKYFEPIFTNDSPHKYNDLKNVISRGMPTTFILSGIRYDKAKYLEEQTLPFLTNLIDKGVNFSYELQLGSGHKLTHTFLEVSQKFISNMGNIEENYTRNRLTISSKKDDSILPIPESSFSVGKVILEDGFWYTKRFGFAELGAKINWEMDPFENRSWVWLLHQFDFFKDLINFERRNEGTEGYEFALICALDWWSRFASPKDSPDFAWHDHGSANRASNMLVLCKEIEKAGVKMLEDTDLFLKEFFTVHAEFLASKSGYTKGTNHGLEQSIVLLSLAAENTQLEWSTEYIELAVKRVKFEVRNSFAEDGGHKENSIHYQEFGLRQIIKTIKVLKKYEAIDAADINDIVDQLENAVRAFAYMISPNGRSPIIGDTEYTIYPNILRDHSSLSAYDSYTYALTSGKDGDPPKDFDLVLPKSGWAVLRSGWEGENDLHLIAKCAFRSQYHRHDDDTSFVLHAFGEEWITDGGLFNYEEKHPMRIHLRSFNAHSISAPDGVQPFRKLDATRPQSEIVDYHSSNECAWVKMHSHMFPGYVSTREIEMERRNASIKITDVLEASDGDNSNTKFTSRFLVPYDKSVTIEGPNVRIQGVNHYLLICPNRRANHVSVKTGQKEPELRGWRSQSFNTIEPAHSIEFEYLGGTLDVQYELNFS